MSYLQTRALTARPSCKSHARACIFLFIMIEIKITITDIGADSLDFALESFGKECNSGEIRMAQRVIKLIKKDIRPGITKSICPEIETITRNEDGPQPN